MDFLLALDNGEVTPTSVALRLGLAVLFGGIIGLERGANKHPAGMRTHILVCIGAALAMLTNQYMYQSYDYVGDPARLGAQVITGVGFLGVGTILVTGRHKIKGLTTAAGLWASACLGLALGIGFYSAALTAGVLIFVSLALLPKIEEMFYQSSRVFDLYVEIDSLSNFKPFINHIKSLGVIIFETHLSKQDVVSDGGVAFYVTVKLPKGMSHNLLISNLDSYEGVFLVEEI